MNYYVDTKSIPIPVRYYTPHYKPRDESLDETLVLVTRGVIVIDVAQWYRATIVF